MLKIVSAIDLAAALKEGDIQLAVINACYSAAGAEQSIAQALVAAGVRSVVAHRWPLIDPAAVLFSQALYRELAAGRSLRPAFDEAVQETTAQYRAEKGNAVLLGDEALRFPRPGGEVQPSQVIEGAALPDKAARFFGRGRELIQLAGIFAQADLRGAALTGIGGIGKSALAFEAADRLAWRFDDRVAYVEAAESGFKAEAALIDLAHMLGLKDSANPIADLRDFVNRQPCLLLFDNMERAGSELYRLADFVSALNLDAGSQALFTLRPPLSDKFHDVREINLHAGLDERAALDFVRTTAYNLNAAPQWQDVNEARALIQRVQGHPELMRLAVYRSLKLPFAKVRQEVFSLSGRLDEALQDLIGKQIEQTGELGYKAITRLTVFPHPRMIVAAAEAACYEAVAGLEKLMDAGVIALEHDISERYVLHATALDWARAHGLWSKREDPGMQQAQIRVAECYADFVTQNHNYEGFPAVEQEIDNIISIAERAYQADVLKIVIQIASELILGQGYLYVRSEWKKASELLSFAIEASRKLDDKKHEGLFIQERATIHNDQGDLDAALTSYEYCLNLYKQIGEVREQATVLHNMAGISVTRGDLNGAMALYQQSLDIKERLGDFIGKSATLHQMAGVLVTRGDLNGAMALYQQSLDIIERLGDLQGKSATLSQMANIEAALDRWDSAKKLLVESLEIGKRLNDVYGIAMRTMKLG